MATVISIFNQKGGCAKTTSTSAFLSSLARRGYKVLGIDCDYQANLTNSFGIDDEALVKSLFDLLLDPKENVRDYIIKDVYGIDLLPADMNLANADQRYSQIYSRETILKRAIAEIENDYDFILIDCPPNLQIMSINSLSASDYVLIPIFPSFFSIKGLVQLERTVKQVKSILNPKIEIAGVFITKYEKTNNSDHTIKTASNNYKVFNTMIRKNVVVEEAQEKLMPLSSYIMNYDRKSTAFVDYENLIDEILEVVTNER